MSFNFLNQGQSDDTATRFQPIDTFIDPVSKIRVSNPGNLIDTDFEYGLQPTKWETVEIINNTPAFFSKSGDTTISDITGITTNAGTREITVTTAFPHNLDVGIPIRVAGTKIVTADGSYIINATPTPTTFTYLSRANISETVSIFDLYSSIITGEFFQGSQISISDSEGITTDGLGPQSTLTVKTSNKHGFGPKTPFYFLNLNSTVSKEFESQNSTSLSFDPTNSATAQGFDGSNTLLQTPIDLSNSANTATDQDNITSVDTQAATFTITISQSNEASWSNISLGDPLYYSVSAGTGFFQSNPRGVVFIKNVDAVDAASRTATFQVSQLPDGTPIPVVSNITGYFQVASQAKTFAGNNINEQTQVQIPIEIGQEFVFDGGNQGYEGVQLDPQTNVGTVIGYTGTTVNLFTAEGSLDYYVGAMLKYESDGDDATGLESGVAYFVTAFAPGQSAGLFTMSVEPLPGQGNISISGGSGTQTFSKIGVSVDKDIIHVRDANFEEDDMLQYTYPNDGTPGNFGADFEQNFYFVDIAYDAHNFKLSEESGFKPLTATGGQSVSDVLIGGRLFRVHKFTSVGSNTFTVASTGSPGSESVDYLIVAGGGGGGFQVGGGGGAGGVIQGSLAVSTQNYTFNVGAGGGGAANSGSAAANGQNSTAFGLTAIGGGKGGNHVASLSTPGNGGSGGGGAGNSSSQSTNGGTGTPGQGNNGGRGRAGSWAGGGGGGSAAAGQNSPSSFRGGAGGDGIQSDITGTLTYYAGGGGGCSSGQSGTPAVPGGLGGGGRGFADNGQQRGGGTTGENGQPNTGGGGGGVRDYYSGGSLYGRAGNGGSGIIIVKYPYQSVNVPGIQATGGAISTYNDESAGIIYQIHQFRTPGTSSFSISSIDKPDEAQIEYLIVGGGGGGGQQVGGGGGAGGFIEGTQSSVQSQSYTVVVGAGGNSTPNANIAATNGQNSSVFGLTAIGGGKGGNHTASQSTPGNGGSGGGGAGNSNSQSVPGGTGTPGQGNNGGSGRASQWAGGGGGGASEPGQGSPSGGRGGKGGDGKASSITGTPTFYAGGGGGCSDGNNTGSDGGTGGGGDGRSNASYGTQNAEANTGGGGGGVRDTGNSGAGGSGIVVIRYPIGEIA